MLELTLQICSKEQQVLAQESGSDLHVVYTREYADGDHIVLTVSKPNCFLIIQLDDVMNPAFVFMEKQQYCFPIPFGEKRVSYNPKAFAGALHLLRVRPARKEEIQVYKNLAQNEYDCHENDACFPHACANVETRGEAVFAARNAIDGNTANRSHGAWPYESWGINRNPDAELTVSFGRAVCVDCLVLTTRADFPHDNWWKQAEVLFSDGSTLLLSMEKSSRPHSFLFEPKTITWLKLQKLIADEIDPSPFPALSQMEVFGTEAE